MSRVNVKYIGPHEAVEITDGQVDLVVQHGETVEVSHDLAHGVPGDVGALGGLLDQEENWELVKPAKAAEKEKAE